MPVAKIWTHPPPFPFTTVPTSPQVFKWGSFQVVFVHICSAAPQILPRVPNILVPVDTRPAQPESSLVFPSHRSFCKRMTRVWQTKLDKRADKAGLRVKLGSLSPARGSELHLVLPVQRKTRTATGISFPGILCVAGRISL